MTEERTITPRNINRAVMLKQHSMAADGVSLIIDFKEMVLGSVQAYWDATPVDTSGTMQLEGTNDIEIERWDAVCGSEIDVSSARLTKMWNIDRIGYRYLRLLYTANQTASGALTVIALAKISR